MPNDGPDGISNAKSAKDVEIFLENHCKKPLTDLANEMKIHCFNFKENKRVELRVEQVNNKHDAGYLIQERLNQYQTIGALTFMAVTAASEEYDLILKMKASETVGTNFLLDLFVSFLPVIKPLERIVGRFISKIRPKDIFTLTHAGKWEHHLDHSFRDNLANAVKSFDETLADTTQAGLKLKEGLDLNDESKLLLNAYAAKNAVFQQALKSIVAELVRVTNLAAGVYQHSAAMAATFADAKNKNLFLPWVENLLTANDLGDASKVIDTEKFFTLSRQFFAGMLGEYAKKFVKIKGGSLTITQLPKSISHAKIEGLDPSQRTMIYDSLAKDKARFLGTSLIVLNDEDLYRRWIDPKNVITTHFEDPNPPAPRGRSGGAAGGYSSSKHY